MRKWFKEPTERNIRDYAEHLALKVTKREAMLTLRHRYGEHKLIGANSAHGLRCFAQSSAITMPSLNASGFDCPAIIIQLITLAHNVGVSMTGPIIENLLLCH
jgi:hypothetical protein